MGKNIIFYFTGTGNGLAVAKQIAEKISNCEIVPIGCYEDYKLEERYDRIGFVYPVYFSGVPAKVKQFIERIKVGENKNSYFFSIATYGGFAGNGISQIKEILEKKEIFLNYGTKLKMFSNYVVMYEMSNKVKEITQKSDEMIEPIIEDVFYRQNNRVGSSNQILKWYYQWRMKDASSRDKDFTVSSECISCGKCKEICPVDNINMKDGKPEFLHHCEHCLACLHYCPQRAIDYKGKTRNRARYMNPKITFEEMIQQKSNFEM